MEEAARDPQAENRKEMSRHFKILLFTISFLLLFAPNTLADNTQPDGQQTITIANFNIQVFGKSKAGKPSVMKVLAQTITNFDIVAIQEIRDKSGTAIKKLETVVDALGTDYDYIIGPRLGRTSSKEQYAFIYNTETIVAGEVYTYDDSEKDLFHREPAPPARLALCGGKRLGQPPRCFQRGRRAPGIMSPK